MSKPAIPSTLRAEIFLQLAQLRQAQHSVQGVYVVPHETNLLTWHGVVFVRAGPYVGGVFRFEIHFPPTFLLGSMTPDVVFPPTLLHPLVDPSTFRLSLSPRFSAGSSGPSNSASETWRPKEHNVGHLLRYLQECFTSRLLDTVSERQVPNKEVFAMYKQNRELFLKLASQSAHLSTSHHALYDPSWDSGLPGPERQGSSMRSPTTAENGVDAADQLAASRGRAADGSIIFRELQNAEYETIKRSISGHSRSVTAPLGHVQSPTNVPEPVIALGLPGDQNIWA